MGLLHLTSEIEENMRNVYFIAGPLKQMLQRQPGYEERSGFSLASNADLS
jgi:hypothetical protein